MRAPLMLLAVWASSFGCALLVEREPLTEALLLDVLTPWRLFGWSEFLTTFLVVAAARGPLLRLADHPRAGLALAAGGLASTLVTTDRMWPLIGGVVGHEAYASFPLLAYPWFLAGLRLGRANRRVDGGGRGHGAREAPGAGGGGAGGAGGRGASRMGGAGPGWVA